MSKIYDDFGFKCDTESKKGHEVSNSSKNVHGDQDSSSKSVLLSDLENKHMKAIIETEPMFLNLLVANQLNC